MNKLLESGPVSVSCGFTEKTVIDKHMFCKTRRLKTYIFDWIDRICSQSQKICEKQPYFQVHTHVPQQGGCLGVVAIHDVFGGDFMSIEVHHSPHFHHSCQVVHGHRHVVQFAGSRFRWVPRVVIQHNQLFYYLYVQKSLYRVLLIKRHVSFSVIPPFDFFGIVRLFFRIFLNVSKGSPFEFFDILQLNVC